MTNDTHSHDVLELSAEELESCCGGVYNAQAHRQQLARWHRPLIGNALFKLDMMRDYISGRGLVMTGSGSPGIGG